MTGRRGFISTGAFALIITTIILIACIFMMNSWFKSHSGFFGSQMHSAAYVADLDYWFVDRVDRWADYPYYFSELYSPDASVRNYRLSSMGEGLSSFGLGEYRRRAYPSGYDFAATGDMCPTLFDESHFPVPGFPKVVCNHVYYVRDDVPAYGDERFARLSRELSTFDQRSFATYARDAFLQDPEGRFAEVVARVRLTR